jgi:hypothetical protein
MYVSIAQCDVETIVCLVGSRRHCKREDPAHVARLRRLANARLARAV